MSEPEPDGLRQLRAMAALMPDVTVLSRRDRTGNTIAALIIDTVLPGVPLLNYMNNPYWCWDAADGFMERQGATFTCWRPIYEPGSFRTDEEWLHYDEILLHRSPQEWMRREVGKILSFDTTRSAFVLSSISRRGSP